MADERDEDAPDTPAGPAYEKPAVSWEEAIDGHAGLMQACTKVDAGTCDEVAGLNS